MPENSSTVPLVRCPKCGHLLPELPPYSGYHCDGCGAFLRVEKGSFVDDGLSEKLWEERTGEASEREGNGEIVGIDRGRGNETSATTSRFSKSPVRPRYGDTIRKSPIRESDSGDLDVARNSPTRGSVLGDFDAQSKSSGRSMDGDIRKSPLKESSLGGLDGRGKSPARSVREGVRKSPIVESVLGEFDEQKLMERDVVADSEEMEARKKVGAWFEQVKEEVEYASSLVTEKGSFNDWLHYEATVGESKLNRNRVSPRRRTWSLDESPMGSGLNPMGRRADKIVDETESKYDDLYRRRRAEVPLDDWVRGGDHGLPRGHRDLRVQDGYVGEFGSRRDEMEQWRAQRNESSRVRGNNRAARVGQIFPVYPNEGLSNYGSYYGYDQARVSHKSSSGADSLQNVEMNRAQLVRMYNEIKEKLGITGYLPESPARRGNQPISLADYYGGPDDYVHDEHSRLRGPVASRFRPNESPFDDDPSWLQIPGRYHHHRPHNYPQQSPHDYIPEHSMDSPYDTSGLNPWRKDLHHPTCSCSHCHPNNLQTHMQDPSAFGYMSYLNCQNDPASDFRDPCGPRFPYSTQNLSSHSRSSVDNKSDWGNSAREHGKRVVVVNQNQLLCHPIAGAAPFVLCCKCFELLRLPKKLITMKKTHFRLQCGSCRNTLSFDFNKKPHASMQPQPKPTSTDVHDVPSKMSEAECKSAHDSSPAGITKPESYDFDATGYTFPSTDSEPSVKLEDRMLNSSEAEKKQGLCPSSCNASKDDNDLDNAVNKTDASDNFAPEQSDERETDVSGHDKGNIDRNSSSLNHVQNADAHSEVEINPDEIPKVDTCLISAETSTKDDRSTNKKGESSFAGITGRGFQDFSPSLNTLDAKADVSVNGQPLSHRAVRMAEKLAGPISPGKYWYDSTAGFWGVMGSCCLGIIPPFIEEFGFPMPVNCAGGNTGIYVNRRELHEKDLVLLASRGFPLTRNKWYVVDISGKVQDEETGDIVVDLGKLAPSVEKAKRGFGMKPLQT